MGGARRCFGWIANWGRLPLLLPEHMLQQWLRRNAPAGRSQHAVRNCGRQWWLARMARSRLCLPAFWGCLSSPEGLHRSDTLAGKPVVAHPALRGAGAAQARCGERQRAAKVLAVPHKLPPTAWQAKLCSYLHGTIEFEPRRLALLFLRGCSHCKLRPAPGGAPGRKGARWCAEQRRHAVRQGVKRFSASSNFASFWVCTAAVHQKCAPIACLLYVLHSSIVLIRCFNCCVLGTLGIGTLPQTGSAVDALGRGLPASQLRSAKLRDPSIMQLKPCTPMRGVVQAPKAVPLLPPRRQRQRGLPDARCTVQCAQPGAHPPSSRGSEWQQGQQDSPMLLTLKVVLLATAANAAVACLPPAAQAASWRPRRHKQQGLRSKYVSEQPSEQVNKAAQLGEG